MHNHHFGRWFAAVAVAGVIAGGATAVATAPPTEPPAASEAMSSEPAAAGTCDAVFAASASADTMAADTMAAEGTMAAETMAAGTMAADASAPPESMAAASAFPLQTAETEFGTILVDANCRALYMFANDTEGESTCVEGCAEAWPPLLVEGGAVPELGAGLDAALFSVVEHPESGPMLKVGDWPLYYFANDAAPGDLNGQGANEVWWVVASDGTPIMTMPEAPATTAGG